MKVLRRANVIVEELSDLAYLNPTEAGSSSSDASDIYRSYDVVAVSARNDATFSAACSTALLADVLILNYAAGRGGVQLPFRLRARDVRAATDRGAAFEIPYGPAVLNVEKRKALVRTCAELRAAARGVRNLRLVISSGSRNVDGKDAGAMALRRPGDIASVARTVMGFDDRLALDATGGVAAAAIVERSWNRRAGKFMNAVNGVSTFVEVSEDGKGEGVPIVGEMKEELGRLASCAGEMKDSKGTVEGKISSKSPPERKMMAKKRSDDEEEGFEDGFITL